MATTPQSYFMGNDGFIWFVGVVEDRDDPSRLGRLRVRCLGFHTESLTELPTTDLPWAHVMHPVTDAAMQGMGTTPSFIAEGAWVVGFFRDAQMKQQPIIIGSLPGIPQSPADASKGFNDPRHPKAPQPKYAGEPIYGPYPVDGDEWDVPSGHKLKEPDTNRLAQGPVSETHNKLKERRATRLRGDPELPDPEFNPINTGVPIATKPFMGPKTTSTDPQKDERTWWDEPHPKGHKKDANPYPSGQYPFNHVFESEAGHITEIDDSPGGSRLFRAHSAGTFEEIHPGGDRVIKIVGDNYEITAGKTAVFMQGNVNITVKGDVRELIKGDYILEVEGDQHIKVHGNRNEKLGAGKKKGNILQEIAGAYSYVFDKEMKGLIHGYQETVVKGYAAYVVEGYNNKSKTGWEITTTNRLGVFVQTSDIVMKADKNILGYTTKGNISFMAKNIFKVACEGDMVLWTEKDMYYWTDGDVEIITKGKRVETVFKEIWNKAGTKIELNSPSHPGRSLIPSDFNIPT